MLFNDERLVLGYAKNESEGEKENEKENENENENPLLLSPVNTWKPLFLFPSLRLIKTSPRRNRETPNLLHFSMSSD